MMFLTIPEHTVADVKVYSDLKGFYFNNFVLITTSYPDVVIYSLIDTYY